MTNKVSELYKAEASNLIDLAMLSNGNVGFRVPEYQRQYDWSRDDIKRVYTGALNGLSRLPRSKGANALTFLGTLILVNEKELEHDFNGQSLAIIDGQQRLTTLALFACALCELLREQLATTDLSGLDGETKDWLAAKVDESQLPLHMCAVGSQWVSVRETYPFPRIVRHNDKRGRTFRTSEYVSPVAQFLDAFSKDIVSNDAENRRAGTSSKGEVTSSRHSKFSQNFKIVQELLSELNRPSWYEDNDCGLFDVSNIRLRECRELFQRPSEDHGHTRNVDRMITKAIATESTHALLRTIMFAAYFCNCIVLTRVTTEDESAAFDIFDSLNTTGQPLTALETLKPRVVAVERRHGEGSYHGSPAERSFSMIEENVEALSDKPDDKQNETRDLIVTFALHLAGRKLPKDLSSQRTFLATAYDRSVDDNSGGKFLELFADTSTFRRVYWHEQGIRNDLYFYHQDESFNEIRLLVSFIRAMRTSLAIPVLARYWSTDIRETGDAEFREVLRAVVAFVVVRRAWTGGTAGVDADLRKLMAGNSAGEESGRRLGLHAGHRGDRNRLTPEELKQAMRGFLEDKGIATDRDAWVERAAKQPLYQHSKALVRFMIFAAAEGSIASTEVPGTWERDGVKQATHTGRYLNYATWDDPNYSTVEHVAPRQGPVDGWTGGLYLDNDLRDSLGNLVMLPPRENAGIGNAPWVKKRLFYRAITETRHDVQKELKGQAAENGIPFGPGTSELLKKGDSLSLLQPLRDVERWDEGLVRTRGRNTAGLCWDLLWPWLAPTPSR